MWGMETYDKKLTRRLKTRAGFPQALQQVPIRYVDEIFALTDRQQELLIEALVNGKSVRQTLPKLKKLGDVNWLWQVMTNLISNGIKFTELGYGKSFLISLRSGPLDHRSH